VESEVLAHPVLVRGAKAAGKKVEVRIAIRTESRNRNALFVRGVTMLLKAGATNNAGRISALGRNVESEVPAHPVLVRNAKAAAGKKVKIGVAAGIVAQAGQGPRLRRVGSG
jgi:hypothetical protein